MKIFRAIEKSGKSNRYEPMERCGDNYEILLLVISA